MENTTLIELSLYGVEYRPVLLYHSDEDLDVDNTLFPRQSLLMAFKEIIVDNITLNESFNNQSVDPEVDRSSLKVLMHKAIVQRFKHSS